MRLTRRDREFELRKIKVFLLERSVYSKKLVRLLDIFRVLRRVYVILFNLFLDTVEPDWIGLEQ